MVWQPEERELLCKALNKYERLCRPVVDMKLSAIQKKEVLTKAKDDFYQIVVQGLWARVGVYQFLNRLLLVLQHPAIITVYRKRGQENEEVFTTFGDKTNRTKFHKHLKTVSEEVIREDMIQIFNTNYSLHFIKVKKISDEKYGPEGGLEFEPYPKDDALFQVVEQLLSKEEANADPFFLHLDANTYWQQNLDKTFSDNSKKNKQYSYAPDLMRNRAHREDIFDIDIASFFRARVFDPVFEEVLGSPLLRGRDGITPYNICYFIRTFPAEGTSNRYFGRYEYDVRLIVPLEQRDSFIKFFEKLTPQLDNLESPWKTGSSDREFQHFEDSRYVDDLKAYIARHGFSDLIELIQQPYGPHTRCFVDPVFSSGFLDIRRDALTGKYGLDRIEENLEYSDEESIFADRIRIAAIYYLFCGMSPDIYDDHARISCLIQPLRVGPSPWVCSVTLTEFHKDEKENFLNWNRYRRFYYDIGVRGGRRIRQLMQQVFMEMVSSIVYTSLMHEDNLAIMEAEKEKHAVPRIDVSRATTHMNEQFYDLSKLFPFRQVFIQPRWNGESSGNDNEVAYDLDAKCVLLFDLRANQHYYAHAGWDFDRKQAHINFAVSRGISQYFNQLG